jgi:hypothetical protein
VGHIEFYRNAEKREKAFLRNMLQLIKWKLPTQNSQLGTILVAGGFHTEGLTQRFKEAGISYLLVTPQMTSVPEQTNYRAHMQGDVSWKDYFRVENGKVNLYKAFVRGTRDRLLRMKSSEFGVSSFEVSINSQRRTPNSKLLLRAWRDQIIRDLAGKNQIAKAHEYTQFLDEVAKRGPAQNENGVPVPFLTRNNANHKVRSTMDDGRKQWLANINRFIEGLRKLESQGQLTEKNILKLLNPSATGDGFTYPVLSSSDSLNLGVLPPNIAGRLFRRVVKDLPEPGLTRLNAAFGTFPKAPGSEAFRSEVRSQPKNAGEIFLAVRSKTPEIDPETLTEPTALEGHPLQKEIPGLLELLLNYQSETGAELIHEPVKLNPGDIVRTIVPEKEGKLIIDERGMWKPDWEPALRLKEKTYGSRVILSVILGAPQEYSSNGTWLLSSDGALWWSSWDSLISPAYHKIILRTLDAKGRSEIRSESALDPILGVEVAPGILIVKNSVLKALRSTVYTSTSLRSSSYIPISPANYFRFLEFIEKEDSELYLQLNKTAEGRHRLNEILQSRPIHIIHSEESLRENPHLLRSTVKHDSIYAALNQLSKDDFDYLVSLVGDDNLTRFDLKEFSKIVDRLRFKVRSLEDLDRMSRIVEIAEDIKSWVHYYERLLKKKYTQIFGKFPPEPSQLKRARKILILTLTGIALFIFGLTAGYWISQRGLPPEPPTKPFITFPEKKSEEVHPPQRFPSRSEMRSFDPEQGEVFNVRVEHGLLQGHLITADVRPRPGAFANRVFISTSVFTDSQGAHIRMTTPKAWVDIVDDDDYADFQPYLEALILKDDSKRIAQELSEYSSEWQFLLTKPIPHSWREILQGEKQITVESEPVLEARWQALEEVAGEVLEDLNLEEKRTIHLAGIDGPKGTVMERGYPLAHRIRSLIEQGALVRGIRDLQKEDYERIFDVLQQGANRAIREWSRTSGLDEKATFEGLTIEAKETSVTESPRLISMTLHLAESRDVYIGVNQDGKVKIARTWQGLRFEDNGLESGDYDAVLRIFEDDSAILTEFKTNPSEWQGLIRPEILRHLPQSWAQLLEDRSDSSAGSGSAQAPSRAEVRNPLSKIAQREARQFDWAAETIFRILTGERVSRSELRKAAQITVVMGVRPLAERLRMLTQNLEQEKARRNETLSARASPISIQVMQQQIRTMVEKIVVPKMKTGVAFAYAVSQKEGEDWSETFRRVFIHLNGLVNQVVLPKELDQKVRQELSNLLRREFNMAPTIGHLEEIPVFRGDHNHAGLVVSGVDKKSTQQFIRNLNPAYIPLLSLETPVDEDPLISEFVLLTQIALALLIAGEVRDPVARQKLLTKPAALLSQYPDLFPGYQAQIVQSNGRFLNISRTAIRQFLIEMTAQAETRKSA